MIWILTVATFALDRISKLLAVRLLAWGQTQVVWRGVLELRLTRNDGMALGILSGNPVAIAEVVRDLYRNENLAEQSYSERQIYEQALDRLANEVAVCDNITSEEATKKLLSILAK